MNDKKLEINPTLHGLENWTHSVFERFGYMMLAHYKGKHEKIESYKLELSELRDKISNRINEVKDDDKKKDLESMANKIIILQNYLDHLFNCDIISVKNQQGGAKNKKTTKKTTGTKTKSKSKSKKITKVKKQ